MASGGHKRARLEPSADEFPPYDYHSSLLPTNSPTSTASTSNANSSNFRNVSACNRCRLRKNRCDQNLPACTSCEKAGVKVGLLLDPMLPVWCPSARRTSSPREHGASDVLLLYVLPAYRTLGHCHAEMKMLLSVLDSTQSPSARSPAPTSTTLRVE